MPKPQYSARVHAQAVLSRSQILCLLTADMDGDIYPEATDTPEWLLAEMEIRGLIGLGHAPGVWRLTRDGLDAREALLE
ncbi:hypothetical protein D3877_16055 [Azospirillum cavernae]|uniref:Uncharacterized protein n=2 Tax=Azospirillum cavernae TaxID=2320860 RepID=A0A418VZ21_9PROT|nr:hypothetical protein D3877_16055 [Azospirillum cavernae]